MTDHDFVLTVTRRANPRPAGSPGTEGEWSPSELLLQIEERSGTMDTIERRAETSSSRSPGPGRRRGLLAAAAALVIAIVAIGVAIAATTGNGQPDVAAQEGDGVVDVGGSTAISSFADVAGTYLRRGPGAPTFLLLQEDGTVHDAPGTNQIVDDPVTIHQTRFEGTNLFMTTTGIMCAQPDEGGTYEIHTLDSGNLQFVAVNEDPCPLRSAVLQGFGNNDVEFEPVP